MDRGSEQLMVIFFVGTVFSTLLAGLACGPIVGCFAGLVLLYVVCVGAKIAS